MGLMFAFRVIARGFGEALPSKKLSSHPDTCQTALHCVYSADLVLTAALGTTSHRGATSPASPARSRRCSSPRGCSRRPGTRTPSCSACATTSPCCARPRPAAGLAGAAFAGWLGRRIGWLSRGKELDFDYNQSIFECTYIHIHIFIHMYFE